MNNSADITTGCPPVITLVPTPYCSNMVCLWCEHLFTCSSLGVPGFSWATNFPSFFRAGFSCTMPCSPYHDPVSISKSSSSINVSTSISSNSSTRGSCPKRWGEVCILGETRDLKGRAGRWELAPRANCCYSKGSVHHRSQLIPGWTQNAHCR